MLAWKLYSLTSWWLKLLPELSCRRYAIQPMRINCLFCTIMRTNPNMIFLLKSSDWVIKWFICWITKSPNHLKLSTIIKIQTSGLHRGKATGLVERKSSSVVSECPPIDQWRAIPHPPAIPLLFITMINIMLSVGYEYWMPCSDVIQQSANLPRCQ